MITIKRHRLILLALALLITASCSAPRTAETARYDFTRNASAVDYSGVAFTPWDVSAAAENVTPRETAALTVMVYMNGSDLESDNGAATADIEEMLNSGADFDAVNVVIFTGGTQIWHNSVVPSDECVVWRLHGDGLHRVAGVGQRNMGDPGTLASFIELTRLCFPAGRYGLIMWDHGGGSIAGYGHDENFGNSRLTLLEMDYALAMSGFHEKLEFIGFDACLMATVEMAVVASEYARYLIASEDLEPGAGWNYAFLSVLNAATDGAEIGRAVADSFFDYYGNGTLESLTMSVTDLQYAGRVMGAMGALMSRCSGVLSTGGDAAFSELSRARYRTATFGGGSVRDSDCDMVDIGDMAYRLSALFPDESASVTAAVEDAVVYNRHNSLKNLSGLTAYYIYGGKTDASGTLPVYSSLGMSGEYTGYLYEFAHKLTGGEVPRGAADPPDTDLLTARLTVWLPDGGTGARYLAGLRDLSDMPGDSRGALWPVIGGVPVCLEKTGQSGSAECYAVPARLNGMDGDIIAAVSGERSEILGFRLEEGYVVQKGFEELKRGDRIAFYRITWDFAGTPSEPVLSPELTVPDGLTLDWCRLEGGVYGVMLTDTALTERHVVFAQ